MLSDEQLDLTQKEIMMRKSYTGATDEVIGKIMTGLRRLNIIAWVVVILAFGWLALRFAGYI